MHDAAVPALLDDPEAAPLVRSLTPPGSFETLVTRMVAFLYLYEDLCAALESTWIIGFAEHLDAIAPGTGKLWQTLGASAGEAQASGLEPPADTTWGDA